MKKALIEFLEQNYARFHSPQTASRDPLARLDLSLRPDDFELTSFLVAGLSYGRVEQIQKSTESLWARLQQLGLGDRGRGLAAYLKNNYSEKEMGRVLQNWSHRLNTSTDLEQLFKILSIHLRESGSLCRLHQISFAESPEEHLENFSRNFLAPASLARVPRSTSWSGTGPAWFASSPTTGSTCKRLMMWMRWMVRRDVIDPGTWQSAELIDPSLPVAQTARLFWPVDTHIFKWSKKNIPLRRKTANWAAVREITKFFTRVCPHDPVRYDFSLCHAGIHAFRKLPPQRNADNETL